MFSFLFLPFVMFLSFYLDSCFLYRHFVISLPAFVIPFSFLLLLSFSSLSLSRLSFPVLLLFSFLPLLALFVLSPLSFHVPLFPFPNCFHLSFFIYVCFVSLRVTVPFVSYCVSLFPFSFNISLRFLCLSYFSSFFFRFYGCFHFSFSFPFTTAFLCHCFFVASCTLHTTRRREEKNNRVAG